jgi:hypothetical protein
MTERSIYIAMAFTVKSRGGSVERRGRMSARDGDKSRYQINRKRAVHRRAKIRELTKSVKSQSVPAPPAAKAQK